MTSCDYNSCHHFQLTRVSVIAGVSNRVNVGGILLNYQVAELGV